MPRAETRNAVPCAMSTLASATPNSATSNHFASAISGLALGLRPSYWLSQPHVSRGRYGKRAGKSGFKRSILGSQFGSNDPTRGSTQHYHGIEPVIQPQIDKAPAHHVTDNRGLQHSSELISPF